jgi:hypothetical protein
LATAVNSNLCRKKGISVSIIGPSSRSCEVQVPQLEAAKEEDENGNPLGKIDLADPNHCARRVSGDVFV